MMPNGAPPIPPSPTPGSSGPGSGQDPFWGALQAKDLQALDLLALFHRVAAGLLGAVSLCGVPYLLLAGSMQKYGPITGEAGPPPSVYGGVFGFVGGAVFFGCLALAVLYWLAGGWIRARKHHTAILVLEVLLLLSIPHGTALGIYGLYLLTKPHVKAAFS